MGKNGLFQHEDCWRCHAPEESLLGHIHPNPEKNMGLLVSALAYQAGLVFLAWGGLRFYVRRSSKGGKRQ